MTQRGQDPALNYLHMDLGFGFIPRLFHPCREDSHPVVAGQIVVGGVGVGLVAMRPAHRRAEIVRNEQLGAAAIEAERPHVRRDPVGQRLRPRRLGVGVVRRPENRDEDLRLAKLSGVAVDHRDRLPRVVDEHLLAGAVLLAHHHVELGRPGPVQLAEPAVLHPLGMRLLVLLPQQRERHPLAAKLAVNHRPLRHREPSLARHRHRSRKQPPLELCVVERLRQRPAQPRLLGATDVPLHRHRRELQAAGNRPTAQTCDMVQPQDLSYFAHGQPPVRHRDPSPNKEWGGSHGRPVVPRRSAPGLRPLAPFQCTPKSDHLANGIGDHLALEWLITLEWNR